MLTTGTTVLVTGGAGYIGSHVCVELLEANYDLVIVDNLSNSHEYILHRIKKITKKAFIFYKIDILDSDALNAVFDEHRIDHVIHMAGRKSVPESVQTPLSYYQTNIIGLLNLLKCIELHKSVTKIVFSSSAAVYGDVETCKITEDLNCCPKSPYGTSKAFCEKILQDFCAQYNGRNNTRNIECIILRYFNPVGAHSSGLIGEDPIQSCTGLIPLIQQVLIGQRKFIQVYGSDYSTRDGSGCRDFVHIMDIATAHKVALEYYSNLEQDDNVQIFNVGSETGYTVLEIIAMIETVCNITIPYKIVDRREGDVGHIVASCDKAKTKLKWATIRGLEDMCVDLWRWARNKTFD